MLDSQCGPVSEGRIGQCHVSLDPDHRLTILHLAVVHGFPVGQALSSASSSARTILFLLSEAPKLVSAASADVAESLSDHPLCVL